MDMVPPLLFLVLLVASSSAAAATTTTSFSLDFFPGTGTGAAAQLALSGAANVTSSAVAMASPRARVQYKTPLVFSSAGEGFSTYFSFALPPPTPSSTTASLAFFLTPSTSTSRSPPALAVVFTATHVRLDLAGRTALQTHQSRSTSTSAATARRRSLHSWIDYNATSATLHVRLSAAHLPTPPPALLSYPLVDLSRVLRRGPMLSGFESSGGNCSLFSWAFHHLPAAATATPPYRMHSQPLNPADLLTTPPPERVHRAAAADRGSYSPWGAAVSLLLAAACGAMVTFFVLFLWYSVSARRPVAPVEHPTDVVYEKIVLVGTKDDDAPPPLAPSGGNCNNNC